MHHVSVRYLFCILFLSILQLSLAQESPAPFTVEVAPFQREDKEKPNPVVTIKNQTSEQLTIHVRVENDDFDYKLKDIEGTEWQTTLKPAQLFQLSFELKKKNPKVNSENPSTILTVWSDEIEPRGEGSTAIRGHVERASLSAVAYRAVSAVSAHAEWAMGVRQRTLAFIGPSMVTSYHNNSIPLAAGSSTTLRTLGNVRSKDGNVLTVEWLNSNYAPIASEVLPIKLTGKLRPGVYTGQLDDVLAPDKKQKLTLTVTIKDGFLLPTFIILLGVICAWLYKRVRDFSLPLNRLDERLNKLPKSLADHGKYSLASDYQTRLDKVSKALKELQKPLASSLDQAKVTEVEKELTMLEGLGDKWRKFGDIFNGFVAALKLIVIHPSQYQEEGKVPKIVSELNNLRDKGNPALTVEDTDKTQNTLRDATELAKEFNDYLGSVSKYKVELDRLDGIFRTNPLQDEAVRNATLNSRNKAERDLRVLENYLWEGQSDNDYGSYRKAVDKKEEDVRLWLYEFEGWLEPTKLDQLNVAQFKERREWPAIARLMEVSVRDSIEEKMAKVDYEAQRRQFETIILVVALLLALVTGLNELYFTKETFGTFWNYVMAFAWGFGTHAILEALFNVGNMIKTRTAPA